MRASSGDIIVRGKRADIRSTTDAIALGIETIYQDSALVTQLSIARNLFLGREPLKGPRFLNRMDKALMEEVAGELLRRVGIGKSIPASTPISSLSGGERQAVAIARAMHFDSDLIILDEPTNNLGVAETQGVLRFVRNARDSRHSCILIANIHHVFQVVDRIAVMRHGRIVADDIDPKQMTVADVEAVITGELAGPTPDRVCPPELGAGEPALAVAAVPFAFAEVCHVCPIGLSSDGVGERNRDGMTLGNNEMADGDGGFHHLLGPGVPTRNFAKGKTIFKEGDLGDEFFVVVRGKVEIRSVVDRHFETLGPDGIFGEMALIDDSPRSATAVAMTDVTVAPIKENQFLFLVKNTPFFALNVMRVLAHRLRRQNKAV